MTQVKHMAKIWIVAGNNGDDKGRDLSRERGGTGI